MVDTHEGGSAGGLMTGISKRSLEIYKKIPLKGEITAEELAEDGMELSEVMTELISLELIGCVTLLPGDRVRRKLI